MAQKLINLGEMPNGIGGDTNRSANVKCNENFTELYEGKAASGINRDITELAGLTTTLSLQQGGTGVKTVQELAALMTTAGLYNQTTAVGNITPVAGHGALLERGENANGEYEKFADGRLICSATVINSVEIRNGSNGFFFSPTSYWNYPIAFVGREPYVGTLAVASGITLSTAYALSKTDCNYFVVAAAPVAAQQYRIKLFAIGWWR